MATLKIRFDYMTLIHSDAGLVCLLPSAGHDASLTVGGFNTPLRGAHITLRRGGAIVTGTRPLMAHSEAGLLMVSDIMSFCSAPQNAAAAPQARFLRDAVPDLPELNARVVLPDGIIEATTKKTTGPLYEFRKTVLGVESRLALGMESVEYQTPLVEDEDYRLQIEQPSGSVALDVSSGADVVIANSDRKSAHTNPLPWFELSYLLNLLELQPMDFLLPVLKKKFISSPNNEPCESIVSGRLTMLKGTAQ